MMQLLSFLPLVFDRQDVRYKLYINPADKTYHFRPEEPISYYPSFSATRVEREWHFHGMVPEHIRVQFLKHLNHCKAAKPLL
jgi:hypothetical protein